MSSKTEELIFKAITEVSSGADVEELTRLLDGLKRQVDTYESIVLLNGPVRDYVYDLYMDRITPPERSISPLVRKFNRSKKGSARGLAAEITTQMQAAKQADLDGRRSNAARILTELQLDYGILLSPEVRDRAAQGNSVLDPIFHYHIIESLWDELYRASIRLAFRVAKQQAFPLSGDVVQYADLVQQAAGIELRRAIEKYVPTDTDDPVRTFASYICTTANYRLAHYIAEQSRTVSIPRTRIDRYRPVLQAMEEGFADYPDLAGRATQILYEKRAPQKLRPKEVYTEDEVYDLVSVMQPPESLDIEVATDESGVPLTLADRIEDPSPGPDDIYDVNNAGRKIMEVFHDYCDSEEYAIMELRWGMGRVKGLMDTANQYREAVGRVMNKTRVAEIEKVVFARLRRGAANGDGRLKEIAAMLEGL